MNIINIGILAHVDAGKTTLTESLLYASGAISEPGSVEKGTTRTDTMLLERQRGITIQAAVTSFQWHRCKVNIVDTPGHMDFLAEVYRSLAVLDGAILVISAKDGVQAQTRILFHALRKMNIPTVIFINKIDQVGVDLQGVYQSVRDKLSADIIIKQTVSLSPEIVLEENTGIEAWDAVIENNDKLLEKYIAGEPISREELAREEQRRVPGASLFPVYHGQRQKGLGIQPLMDAVTRAVPTDWGTGGAPPYAAAFSRWSIQIVASGSSICGYTAERCACGIRWPWPGGKAENHRDAYSIQREIVRTDTAHKVSSSQRQRGIKRRIGGMLPRERWRDAPSHACGRRLRRKRQRKENGCWTLLLKLRILTRFCATRWIPSPTRSFFLF